MSALLLAVAFASGFLAGNWPQFRGINCAGVAENESPPVQFDEKTNLLWKVEIERGHSSPIVWDKHIFLTAYTDTNLQVLCFDRPTGKRKWRRSLEWRKVDSKHRANNPASSTPATDGRVVCSYFPSFGLVGHDFDGKELWRKALPEPLNPYGAASSPSLIQGNFVLNCEDDGPDSCLLAVNPSGGETVWRKERRGLTSTYSTPILWEHDGQSDLMHASSFRLIALDPRTGSERWFAGGLEWMSQVATPVLGENMIFVMSRSNADDKDPDFATTLKAVDANKDGKISRSELPAVFERWWFKLDGNGDGYLTESEWKLSYELQVKSDYGLLALKPGRSGEVTDSNIVWRYKKGIAQVPSPIYVGGILYMINDGGRLTAFNARTGAIHFEQERLGADGEYFASPVAASGRVYFASNRGTVSVIQSGQNLQVLSRNKLGEEIMATPAIADETLFMRTAHHLWAFGTRR